MVRLTASFAALITMSAALIHGASIAKNAPKQPFPQINISNSSIVINYFGFPSTSGGLQNRQIQEHRKSLQTLLKALEGMLDQMLDLAKVTRDAKQIKSFVNATKAQLRTIEATLKGPTLKKSIISKRVPTETTKAPRNLAILFQPKDFKLKRPHKVQGWYRNYWKYIFINDSKLSSSPTFVEVKQLLDSFFVNAEHIRSIQQISSIKNGKKVVRVVSMDGTIPSNGNKLNYCDADGKRYEGSELGRRSSDFFRKNDINGPIIRKCDCRTILFINPR